MIKIKEMPKVWNTVIVVFFYILIGCSAKKNLISNNNAKSSSYSSSSLSENKHMKSNTSCDEGSVFHKKTGLCWNRCLIGQTWDGATCKGNATKGISWEDATVACSELGERYRLPSRTEFANLLERCVKIARRHDQKCERCQEIVDEENIGECVPCWKNEECRTIYQDKETMFVENGEPFLFWSNSNERRIFENTAWATSLHGSMVYEELRGKLIMHGICVSLPRK